MKAVSTGIPSNDRTYRARTDAFTVVGTISKTSYTPPFKSRAQNAAETPGAGAAYRLVIPYAFLLLKFQAPDSTYDEESWSSTSAKYSRTLPTLRVITVAWRGSSEAITSVSITAPAADDLTTNATAVELIASTVHGKALVTSMLPRTEVAPVSTTGCMPSFRTVSSAVRSSPTISSPTSAISGIVNHLSRTAAEIRTTSAAD